jgi:hypothetical protein
MKSRNNVLWHVVVALALLLGAGAAQAQDPDVILDPDTGNVIAINNLVVREITYDVEFVFEDGYTAYGDNLDEFDFLGANEADVIMARGAVNDALNANVPVPDAAGPEGEVAFFIGFDADEDDAILAVGGEKIGLTWKTCSDNVDCLDPLGLIGATLFLPDEVVSWARFTESGTGTPTPEISIMPTSQVLSASVLTGEDANDQEFGVGNSGEGTLSYAITVRFLDGQDWLSVNPSSGTATSGETDMITVSYATAGLEVGVYDATVTVSDPEASNDPQTVDVTLFVTELPAIGVSETMLLAETQTGSSPFPQSFKVGNVGGLVLIYDVIEDIPWLSVDPENGFSVNAAHQHIVTYDTTGLLEGEYRGSITVTDPAAVPTQQTIEVVLTVSESIPANVTEVTLTGNVASGIPGLSYGPQGTYSKPGVPLLLPQTGFAADFLFHAGGSFTFGSSATATTVTYGDWTYEVRSTCAAGADQCNVDTDNGNPFALRNVDLEAGTALMVFTPTGASAFNNLAGAGGPLQVFATSVQYKGNFPGGVGLDGADAACTLAATNADLSGTWTAWLSDDTTDARDRISDGEYRLLDGTLVANSLADLTDGMLVNPINIDELGAPVSANADETWTATDSDGTYSGGGTCTNWTSILVGSVAQIGLATEMDATWTDVDFEDTCDTFNRLYCFSAPPFQAEDSFANTTFIPEPSAAALATAALTTLGLMRLASRRRRR